MRRYNPLDRLIMQVDTGLRTMAGRPVPTERPNPGRGQSDAELSPEEARLVGGLMRINHAGEVSAQGLYQGQALTAKLPRVREKMERAALEENDHLIWCEQRCKEVGTHVSHLNPVWYFGSVAIGALAGKLGDKWSLGFVVETERQVVKHLDEHIEQLPSQDRKSRAILEQMKSDEQRHATMALRAGGADLPLPVRKLMGLTSKIMTKAAFWI